MATGERKGFCGRLFARKTPNAVDVVGQLDQLIVLDVVSIVSVSIPTTIQPYRAELDEGSLFTRLGVAIGVRVGGKINDHDRNAL